VAHSIEQMEKDVRLAGASSIGLTIYPPYPKGLFKNPQLTNPYTYQNGGDWTWFGGRMIQQMVAQGCVAAAYHDIQPMLERVIRQDDFYEWWSRKDKPEGSSKFHGSAGGLGRAIEMLQQWAQQHKENV
jgi:hypothetical protein